MNYHKLKQNKFNKNHEWNGITHFFNFPFLFFIFSSLCLLYCYSLQLVMKTDVQFLKTDIQRWYMIYTNDNAFLICIDMWCKKREPVRDNWENNFRDNWIVLGSNESSSWFYINYDRQLFFSPFLFLFFYPLPPVFRFLLVIIYAYHSQSVKAVLKLLGPLTEGAAFLHRSPGDDLTLFILRKWF